MLLVLVITHALASVLVIHGKHPNLVNCRSLLDEVVLDMLSDGIYVACTLDTSFMYCVDDECEVVSRTPDDLNHVLCKLQVEFSINLPIVPVVNPMFYYNESARPPRSELFDDRSVASILFSAPEDVSNNYTACTICVVTSHLEYIGLG